MSSSFQEWQTRALIKLHEAESLKKIVDPEATPFKSKYEAVDLYQKIVEDLEKLRESLEKENFKDRYWLALYALHFEISSIHVETEDLPGAEKSLQNCVQILSKNFENIGFIIESFSVNGEANLVEPVNPFPNASNIQLSMTLPLILLYNQLAFLKCMKLYFDTALPFLNEAENLYYLWQKNKPSVYSFEIDDLIKLDSQLGSLNQLVEHVGEKHSDENQLEKIHIMTCYYLAQVYEQTGSYDQSARYCHKTLRLQYPYLIESVESQQQHQISVDHVEWALNAATLSQYFATQDQYNVARHMICCARKVLNETPEKKQKDEEERYRKAHADLDRIEVKYCLMLLNESAQLKQDESFGLVKQDTEFRAFLLNDEKVSQMETKYPVFPVFSPQEASKVFKHALIAIERAKKFFTFTERCSDYVDCTIDQSQIYAAMLPFDSNIENSCKMTKRRIDLLSSVSKELNPQYFLQHCRKLCYELGDIYSQQVSFKMLQHRLCLEQSQLSDDDVQKISHYANKINLLARKSIIEFHKFLSSFDFLNKNKKRFAEIVFEQIEMFPMCERINDDNDNYIKPILTAYLATGSMFTKMITTDASQQVKLWMEGEKYYQSLKIYLEANQDHREAYFQECYEQLVDMLRLIPGKIQHIISSQMVL